MKKLSSKLLCSQASADRPYVQSARLLALGLCTAWAGIALPTAHAASATWIGAADSTLDTGANWSTGAVPAANGDVMTFNSASGLGTLTWSTTMGPGFGSTLGLDIVHQGAGSLTLDSSTGSVINLGDIVIEAGAGAFALGNGGGSDGRVQFRNGDASGTFTNNSSNAATLGSGLTFASGGGTARTLTFGGSGAWNVNVNVSSDNNGNNTAIVKNGAGTLTLNANQTFADVGGITISGGTLALGASGRLGSGAYAQAVVNNGAFAYNSALAQTLSGVVSGSGTLTQSAGSLTLTGVNTYAGVTTINGGALTVGGAGSINSSGGLVINGASAKYVHTSSVASTRAITLTQGTLDGTGTVGAVTVGDGTGGVVTNSNGGSSALTIGSLSFQGAAAIDVREDGNIATSGVVVSGALSTTPANGQVTVNATQLSWNNGVTYDLLSFGSFSGALSDFTKGVISGLTSRQSSSLVLGGSTLGLSIVGDTPKWTGADSGAWVVGATGASGNWQLITAGTSTDYIQGDVVLFDDSAASTAVSISGANVSPSVVNFANSAQNYTVGGAFGIAAGTLNKSGSGTVTISTANTYAGGSNISGGTLALAGSGTLGATTGALSLGGGTLDLGGTSQTVGATTISAASTLANGTLAASSLSATNTSGNAVVSANLVGAGGLSKSGAGALTLSGNNSYTGATVINGGVVALSGSGSLGSTSSVTLGGGSLDLGGTSQSTTAVTISAPTAGATISNGTLTPASLTVTATSGTVGISANLAGTTGISITGGGTTVALSGDNTFTGALTLANNSAVVVNGGSNTGAGAIAYNSFGTSVTINGGGYVAGGVTSSGNSDFRFLNLNGGTFQSNGNLFASGAAIATVFNGGTLRVGNAAGVTLFDSNNTVDVQAGGATIDTTVGDLVVGTNASSANPVALAVSGGGAVNLVGGGSLVSRITGNGALSIQDGSDWNLNGSVNNSAASLALSDAATITVNLGGVGIDNATALITLSGLFTETLDGGAYGFDFGGFDFQTAGSYKLVGFGAVAGTFSAADFFALNADIDAGLAGEFVLDADSLSYVVSAIPEPSAFAALAGLAGLGLAGLRRRPRRA